MQNNKQMIKTQNNPRVNKVKALGVGCGVVPPPLSYQCSLLSREFTVIPPSTALRPTEAARRGSGRGECKVLSAGFPPRKKGSIRGQSHLRDCQADPAGCSGGQDWEPEVVHIKAPNGKMETN